MDDRTEVRLRILAMLIPAASRHGISNPAEIIQIATGLEKYVVESVSDVRPPDTSNRTKLTLPRKEKQLVTTPDFMTPPTVDKSK